MRTYMFGVYYQSGRVNVIHLLVKGILVLTFSIFSQSSFCQDKSCKRFMGKWETPDKDIIQIYHKNGKIYGKIIRLGEPFDEKGKPWKDELNPNKSLRNRPVKGIDILEGLQCNIKGNELIKGKVYLPEEGEKLSCSLKMLSPNQLEVKVTVGIFSDTEKWIKLKENE